MTRGLTYTQTISKMPPQTFRKSIFRHFTYTEVFILGIKIREDSPKVYKHDQFDDKHQWFLVN